MLCLRCIAVVGLVPAGLAECSEQGTARSLLALHPPVLSQKQQECPCRSLFSHNVTQCPTCFVSATVPGLKFGCGTVVGWDCNIEPGPESSPGACRSQARTPLCPTHPGLSSSDVWASQDTQWDLIHLFPAAFPRLALSLCVFKGAP